MTIQWDTPAKGDGSSIKWDAPGPTPTNPIVSGLAQAGNAAWAGGGPIISALAQTLGHLPLHFAVAAAPQLLGKMGISPEDQKPILQQFQDYKTAQENYLAQGQRERPIQSAVAQGLGGAASALALPGGAAAKETGSIFESALNAARPSAAYGAVSGYLGSKAKDWKGKLADELRGFGYGGAIGGGVGTAAGTVGAAADAAAPALEKFGLSKLTKATVGSSSRAFKLLRKKGLSDDSSRYLGNLVEAGDSTESIAEKLVNRGKELRDTMDDTVGKLDATGGTVDPEGVAKRIEEAAKEFEGEATDEDYKALMERAQSIRNYFKGRKLKFPEAVRQRKLADKKANWNAGKKDINASEAMKTTSRAWNDEVDDTAEPFLRQQGDDFGDAYRNQRHEYATVAELREKALENLDRQQGRDEGMISGAVNYVPRTYGKAATGRTALKAADFLSGDHDQFVDFLRGAALSPLSRERQK